MRVRKENLADQLDLVDWLEDQGVPDGEQLLVELDALGLQVMPKEMPMDMFSALSGGIEDGNTPEDVWEAIRLSNPFQME